MDRKNKSEKRKILKTGFIKYNSHLDSRVAIHQSLTNHKEGKKPFLLSEVTECLLVMLIYRIFGGKQ